MSHTLRWGARCLLCHPPWRGTERHRPHPSVPAHPLTLPLPLGWPALLSRFLLTCAILMTSHPKGTHHYMTLGGGPVPNTTVADAEIWCNKNASCHGFTYLTAEANQPTDIYFRDETQIFFMDSEVTGLSQPLGTTTYTSCVHKSRAAPLSPSTNGLQVWIKDVSGAAGANVGAGASPKMALLLVNLGDTELASYTIPFGTLPGWFAKGGSSGKSMKVRDAWNHQEYAHALAAGAAGGNDVHFQSVAPHDSVFLILSW